MWTGRDQRRIPKDHIQTELYPCETFSFLGHVTWVFYALWHKQPDPESKIICSWIKKFGSVWAINFTNETLQINRMTICSRLAGTVPDFICCLCALAGWCKWKQKFWIWLMQAEAEVAATFNAWPGSCWAAAGAGSSDWADYHSSFWGQGLVVVRLAEEGGWGGVWALPWGSWYGHPPLIVSYPATMAAAKAQAAYDDYGQLPAARGMDHSWV